MGVPARTSTYCPGLQKTEMPKSMAFKGDSGVLSRNINCAAGRGGGGGLVTTAAAQHSRRRSAAAAHQLSAQLNHSPAHILGLDVTQHDVHAVALSHRPRHLAHLRQSQTVSGQSNLSGPSCSRCRPHKHSVLAGSLPDRQPCMRKTIAPLHQWHASHPPAAARPSQSKSPS